MTQRPTIDTSFKRAQAYEEFEIEAWFPGANKYKSFTTIQSQLISLGTPSPLAIVCGCAFVTLTSGCAHLHLLHKIFEIAEEDTGKEVQFSYMHGEGIKTITADTHKGKALGELSFHGNTLSPSISFFRCWRVLLLVGIPTTSWTAAVFCRQCHLMTSSCISTIFVPIIMVAAFKNYQRIFQRKLLMPCTVYQQHQS